MTFFVFMNSVLRYLWCISGTKRHFLSHMRSSSGTRHVPFVRTSGGTCWSVTLIGHGVENSVQLDSRFAIWLHNSLQQHAWRLIRSDWNVDLERWVPPWKTGEDLVSCQVKVRLPGTRLRWAKRAKQISHADLSFHMEAFRDPDWSMMRIPGSRRLQA